MRLGEKLLFVPSHDITWFVKLKFKSMSVWTSHFICPFMFNVLYCPPRSYITKMAILGSFVQGLCVLSDKIFPLDSLCFYVSDFLVGTLFSLKLFYLTQPTIASQPTLLSMSLWHHRQDILEMQKSSCLHRCLPWSTTREKDW